MIRSRRAEDGFTLIELMMVVLIIAVLIAIAIPTFIGAQDAARDRSAQSDLRNALTAAKTIAADAAPARFLVEGVDLTPAGLQAAEPSQLFDVIGAASVTVTGVRVAPGGLYITLLKQSATSEWFAIASDPSGRVEYCRGALPADCDDGETDAFTASAW